MSDDRRTHSSARQRAVIERLKKLSETLVLRDVRTVSISGSLPFDMALPYEEVRYEPEEILYSADDNQLAYRVGATLALIDGDKDVVADLKCTLVLMFEADEGALPDEEIIGAYAEANALFMAWPYLRETFRSLSTRLGLDPVVLGVLLRGQRAPKGVTRVGPPQAIGRGVGDEAVPSGRAPSTGD